MAEFDDQLREAFVRAAEPGDPSGVADVLRSRMAHGETGNPSASSGFGSGVASWLPWIGLIVVAGLIGGAVGVLGFAGRPVEAHAAPESTGVLGAHSVGLGCIGGPAVASLPAGERVLAIARSDDSGWLGIRNPVTLTGTVWVPILDVTVDRGQPAIDTLPVGGGCPVVSVATDHHPVVVKPHPPAPPVVHNPPPPPPPKPDTLAPTLGKPTSSVDPVCSLAGNGPYTATISVSATDNVGVTKVTIGWAGVTSGSATMSKHGSTWKYTYTASSASGGQLTFTVRASDAEGNHSATGSVTIQQAGCVG